jgi:hypothetical protein
MTTDRLEVIVEIPDNIQALVWSASRGCYQAALLGGREPWSGKSLRGRARHYGAKYARSRESLVSRIRRKIRAAGWEASTKLVLCGTPRRWRRELVMRAPTGEEVVW